jgi:glucokinase
MENNLTLGIDLGGTGIKMGIVNSQGKLLRTAKISTPSQGDARLTTSMVVREVNELLSSVGKTAIQGIGIGVAGDVDQAKGVVRMSPNLGWKNFPIRDYLAKYLKYPITVDNDANAAAWAAYVVETKKKVQNLICVTLGTGIGGGIVLNGRLYHGATGSAGEIGHMTLFPQGIQCKCGNYGCLERYVGARAMIVTAKEALNSGEKTLIRKLINNDLSRVTPMIIQEAGLKGDPLAIQLWAQAGENLGVGLASLINVLNPEIIILAGGLSRAGSLFLNPLKRTLLERAFAAPARAVKIMISRMDQELGTVGAGLIAQ